MESKKNIPKGDFKIGQRVKTLREGQSLTQKELADMVAISPSSIARLESGETMTSVSTLLKIAEAFADCRDKRTPVPYSADSLRHN